MTAQHEAILIGSAHVEARRLRAREERDLDTLRYCEAECGSGLSANEGRPLSTPQQPFVVLCSSGVLGSLTLKPYAP